MFGNGNRSGGAASAKRGSFSVLGAEVTVSGDITAADLHLDGRIDGDVSCGSLVLCAGGQIAGSVTADCARIAGTITGAVSARELTVEGGARITGDIAYEAITIDTGAQVDGQLRRIVRDEGGEAALIVDARPEDPLRLFNVESPAA